MIKNAIMFILTLIFLTSSHIAQASVEEQDWKNIYSTFLKENQEIELRKNTQDVVLPINRYALYDINQDKIPELICGYGIHDYKFFTITNGAVTEIASFISTEENMDFFFSAPKDKTEKALYYQRPIYYYNSLRDYNMKGIEIFKIQETDGVFETISVAKSHLEANNRIDLLDITASYFRDGNEITEYEFYHGLGLGSALPFVKSNTFLGFDVPEYSMNTIFDSVDFYSSLLSDIELHPQISNPCISDIGYNIYYPNGVNENQFPDGIIETNLLMINGTFIPKARIVADGGIMLVPLRVVSDYLGKTVVWDGKSSKVTVIGKNESLSLFVTDNGNVIDEKGEDVGFIKEGAIYVPAKLIERLNTSVDTFINDAEDTGVRDLNVISIETNYSGVAFLSTDEAKQKILNAVNECNQYLKAIGIDIRDGGFYVVPPEISDGIPNTEVMYMGSVGRYYVYEFVEYENSRILINKYTGEIFSRYDFVCVGVGLPDIRYYYPYDYA